RHLPGRGVRGGGRHRDRGPHRAHRPAPGRMVHPGDRHLDPPGRRRRGPRPMTAPTVLLAPDKFKGSLTAQEVADALAAGILETCPGARLLTCPIADGGDGTVDAAVAAGFA